jgi:hypothetical protein
MLGGVSPEAYERGDNLMRFVIQPALMEVNGLSDIDVDIDFVRRHCRAPIAAVTICWWKKTGDEFRAATGRTEPQQSWTYGPAQKHGPPTQLRVSFQQFQAVERIVMSEFDISERN